ncbi:MAG: AMP-binding protein [Clostridia bacterium]|nr:AMP-binding protein [Clostridia bacterium]
MDHKYAHPLNPTDYYQTFPEFLREISKKYGDEIAITTYNRQGDKIERSYRVLNADVERLASAFLGAGYEGANIAVIGENSYFWVVAYLAAAISGNVAVCIDIEQSENVLRDMLVSADCRVAVASPNMASLISKLLVDIKRQTGEEILLLLNKSEENRAVIMPDNYPYLTIDDFCAKHSLSAEALAAAGDKIQPRDTAAIVFTSGTVSISKPVMLSHIGLLFNAADALALVDKQSHCFAVLPFYHTYSFTGAMMTSLIGKMNVCINGDLKTLMRDMTAFKPSIVIAVPIVVESIHKMLWTKIEEAGQKKKVKNLMKIGSFFGNPSLLLKAALKKKFRGTAVERLVIMMSGGAYLAPRVAEDMEGFGFMVLQGYGITECSPLVSINRCGSYDHNSVGPVVPNSEVRVVDDEIQVRGINVMNGYYKRPDLTAESMDGEWFKTGDIGSLDKKGHLHIYGRKKNLIVMNNGKKISPEEYEGVLRDCSLVKEVVAYGANSGSSVDDVKIAIMVYPDPDITAGMTSYEILAQLQQEVDILNSKLPTFKQIQMINIRDTEFSKTASRKIKRKIV